MTVCVELSASLIAQRLKSGLLAMLTSDKYFLCFIVSIVIGYLLTVFGLEYVLANKQVIPKQVNRPIHFIEGLGCKDMPNLHCLRFNKDLKKELTE